LIEQNGESTDSISKNTSYLVVGEILVQTGKSISLGVEQLGEKELIKLIAAGGKTHE